MGTQSRAFVKPILRNMDSVKQIELTPIDSKSANEFVRKHHYSGKVVNNSQLHVGAFWKGKLEGVMSFGPSLDKRKIIGLVRDTGWNEFLELNRMAFSDALPRNSESRCIAIAMKLIRKHAPQVKWVISFADATQCGDGTIYRASGFVLTGINGASAQVRMPSGEVRHRIALHTDDKFVASMGGAMASVKKMAEFVGGSVLHGFQLRYIYFLDPTYRARLTVPELPFSEIEKRGASMYKGEKVTRALAETETGAASSRDTGGANPTNALQKKKTPHRVTAEGASRLAETTKPTRQAQTTRRQAKPTASRRHSGGAIAFEA